MTLRAILYERPDRHTCCDARNHSCHKQRQPSLGPVPELLASAALAYMRAHRCLNIPLPGCSDRRLDRRSAHAEICRLAL